MQSRHGIVITAIAIILFLLPSLAAEAALDTGVNQTGNHTAFNVTSNSFTEVVGANLSLTSTAAGTYYGMFIAEVRTNWTGAQGQARVIMDGTTLGTYNLTSLTYFTTAPLFFAVPVSTGDHYLTVQMAVENVSAKQRIMYVNKWNMTVGFMRNFDVNVSVQIAEVSQVTGLRGEQDAQNASITALQVNDTTHDTKFNNVNTTTAALQLNDTGINSTIDSRTTEFRGNDTNINGSITSIATEFRNNDTNINGTINGWLNQGVRTTDSPTFAGVNSSYYNTSDGKQLQNGCVGFGYSYCIGFNKTDGTTIEAINGTTGAATRGTNFSLILQNIIDEKPRNPVVLSGGLFTALVPITKNYTEPISIIGSQPVFVSTYVAGQGTAIRASSSMTYGSSHLIRFVGRGSLENLILDGNNRVNTVLDASYPSLGVNYTLFRYVTATQGLSEAVNITNADTATFDHVFFTRSPVGLRSNAIPGQIKLFDPTFSYNTNYSMVLNNTDTVFVYGGIWSANNLNANYVSDVYLVGGVRLELYGTWMENSYGSNFLGEYNPSTNGLPSVSLFGGRYVLSSLSTKEAIKGQYNVFRSDGYTRLIGYGTTTNLTNFTNTTNLLYLDGAEAGSKYGQPINYTNVSRYCVRDPLYSSVTTNVSCA